MSFLVNNKDRKEKSKSVVVTGRVSEDVYNKFKEICDSAGFSVSEAVRLLVINEVTPKKHVSQQESKPRPEPSSVATPHYEPKPLQSDMKPPQPKPIKSFNPTMNPNNFGRFNTNKWKFNNMLPCPICNKWVSATNFSRHAKVNHDNSTTEEIFTTYADKADEMVQAVNSQERK